jgi:hypothetical protein
MIADARSIGRFRVVEPESEAKHIGELFSMKTEQQSEIKYKYNEGRLLREITDYINNTYGEHYSQNKYQATEFIIDGGHGIGFTIGNILKYAQRYSHKGTPEDWRKDLLKVIHYAIIALHIHDADHKE